MKRYTPNFIKKLEDGEIFVFGSNLAGMHAGGAARVAVNNFGAEWGKGVGLQGQSYAPYVDEFIDFAAEHPELTFLVTRIGCGIAGFTAQQMAPLFARAAKMENVVLPRDFAELL